MKVAIVHDWLVTNAGAEKVLKEILYLYPNADIFSIVDMLSESDRNDIIQGKFVTTSFIQNLPFSTKYFRNYLPLFPIAVESFDLSKYDLIISSSWAFAKGIKKIKNQLHICYCHTPIRYAWDLYDEYTNNLPQPKKFFVEKSLQSIKKWDKNNSINVDFFIANSYFVANRIKKSYNRDSEVIYPPVDTDKFTFYQDKEEFFLTASRLVSYKKTKLIVEAFNKMPNKKLIVIGTGEEYNNIKKLANDNITLLGKVSDATMVYYMQRAKAFVYIAIEDFGISPVEAMCCGTPVIALDKGGTNESISIDNPKCGIKFKKQKLNDLIDAIKEFEKIEFNYDKIFKYAQIFSYKIFRKKFKNYIERQYEKKFG